MNTDAREDFLGLLGRLGERLWVPHQVGLEFHRNRFTLIHDQEQLLQKLRGAVADSAGKLRETINSVRDHPVVDRQEFAEVIEDAFRNISTYLEKLCSEPILSIKAAMEADPVLDTVTALLEGKVGSPYTNDQMVQVDTDAKRRIQEKRPPGYSDAKKDDDRAIGDYVLWRQVLDQAIERKLPVLLVTNDQKEDWYRRHHGITIGPRTELVAEMHEEAGVAFHAQTLVRFVETAASGLPSAVKEATVSEVSRLDEADRAARTTSALAWLADNRLTGLPPELDRFRSQSPARPGVPQEQLTDEILRLEVVRNELSHRVAEMRAELKTARDIVRTADRPEADEPRSYVRALETRLEATLQLLDQVNAQIHSLQ